MIQGKSLCLTVFDTCFIGRLTVDLFRSYDPNLVTLCILDAHKSIDIFMDLPKEVDRFLKSPRFTIKEGVVLPSSNNDHEENIYFVIFSGCPYT